MTASRVSTLLLCAAVAAAVACGGDSTGVAGSPLQGLAKVGSTDTSGNAPPPTTPPPGDTGTVTPPPQGTDTTAGNGQPGAPFGTILGTSEAPVGSDTLSMYPRLANVKVSVYKRLPSSSSDVVTGDLVASVLTGSDGKFQLPEIPAAEYVTTFIPPADSKYRGVYAFGPINANQALYPWWIVLPLK